MLLLYHRKIKGKI